MIGNKYSGDNIAADFFRLVNKSAPQGKALEAHASDVAAAAAEDNDANDKGVDAKDFLVRNNAVDSNNLIVDLENKIDDFGGAEVSASPVEANYNNANKRLKVPSKGASKRAASLTPDKRTLKILNGLGKIAGGLRRKGEGFAADVVEATAMSVRNESLNEAKKKAFVLTELSKISKDLKSENNSFASDLVLATANKILKY